jgi:hypothetical protein
MSKGRERSQKWYFQNEKEVMIELGFTPAKGSGSGWIDKEDGENDYLIAQLKSTDKQSYKLNQLDIEKLEYHAMVSRKTPVFVIQFLNKDSRYALMAIDDIPKVAEYIKTGEIIKHSEELILSPEDDIKPKKSKPTIKSNANARDKFNKQRQKDWEDRKWK